jgi:hypothetical protein
MSVLRVRERGIPRRTVAVNARVAARERRAPGAVPSSSHLDRDMLATPQHARMLGSHAVDTR